YGGAGFFHARMGSGRPDDRPLDEVAVAAEQGLGGQVAAERAVLDTATEELEQRLGDLRVGRAGRLWPEVGEGDVLAAGGDQAAGDPGDRLSDRDRVGPGLTDAVLDLAGRAAGEGAQQRLAAGEVPVQRGARDAGCLSDLGQAGRLARLLGMAGASLPTKRQDLSSYRTSMSYPQTRTSQTEGDSPCSTSPLTTCRR